MSSVLSYKEQDVLALLAKEGRIDARNKLIMSMYAFMWGMAIKLTSNRKLQMELVNEATISLVDNAIRKFDPSNNVYFSTYASFWIHSSMRRYILTNLLPIRLPEDVAGLYRKNMLGYIEKVELGNERIDNILNISFIPDTIPKDGDDSVFSILDTIGVPFEYIKGRSEDLNMLFVKADLTLREMDIIKKRFGIITGYETLDVIAEEYHLTGERIRGICLRAVNKIKKYLGVTE